MERKTMSGGRKSEKRCGECCWFYCEMTDGDGLCAEAKGTQLSECTHCSNKCWLRRGGSDNPCFVSRADMRHYMAVLLQYRRFNHDCNVKAIRKPVDNIQLGKAIDFAYKYMKIFSEL